MFKSDKRLWLTADGATVVEDGDPRARVLLVAAGGEIDDALAKKFGLPEYTQAAHEHAQAPADEPTAMKAQAPDEDKAQHRRSTK